MRPPAPWRIAVFGPESTGKTTLAEMLADHFTAPLVTEYARERWEAQGGLSLVDMLPIALEQWRREDAAVQQAQAAGTRLVICDTDALTTMLWSDLLYGSTPDVLRCEAEVRCKNYTLYLLCDIDLPFAHDPQRCFPEPADRVKAMALWRGALDQRGLTYVLIRGTAAERTRAAIEAVERLQAG
jgi:NadR type nicotinamide-nucleotide adenylyltransferase